MSGDLIVKFRDASEPGRALADVLAGRRTMASLAPLATQLSTQLEVPLVLAQATSGREALLAVDREALARALLARAGREAAVRLARMTVPPPGSGLPGVELLMRIEWHSRTSEAVRAGLPARLALPHAGPPRAERTGPDDAMTLHYDIDALTLALIGRLQQRPDVEYAQANRLLRTMTPPAASAPR